MFNNFRKVFIFIYALSISMCVFSQNERAYNDSLKKVAQKQIVELQKSFLIIRLDFKKDQMDYYIKHDNIQAAENLKQDVHDFNQKIIDGIRASFHFCPVFFMDSRDTPKLLQSNLGRIVFYSDELKPDSTIHISITETYFVGEYSFTKDENMYSDSTEYYGSNNLGIPAIVIMDKELNQLKRPFPYYCKFSSNLLNTNKVKSKIDKWNTKLNNYYSLNNKSLE